MFFVAQLEEALQRLGDLLAAMSRRLLNLGGDRVGDHYADFVRGATAVDEFSCRVSTPVSIA